MKKPRKIRRPQCEFHKTNPFKCECEFSHTLTYAKKWRKVIPKKSESKYVSAFPKILNGPSLLTWESAMSSIIFGPFRLLGNAHLFNWLFRWLVGVDMWCQSCRSKVRIRRRVRENIQRISNLLKMLELQTLSNSNANFVTSLDEILSSWDWDDAKTLVGHETSTQV